MIGARTSPLPPSPRIHQRQPRLQPAAILPVAQRQRPVRRAVAARTFELAEFLLHVVGFNRKDEGPATTVTLHTSCSARREMGTHLVGRELLARLGNVTLAHHDHESECCGFGGSFSLKHPDISTAMVTDKVASLKATGARQMVTADCGCMLNITKRAALEDQNAGRAAPSLPGEHLATFLLRRTGGKQS